MTSKCHLEIITVILIYFVFIFSCWIITLRVDHKLLWHLRFQWCLGLLGWLLSWVALSSSESEDEDEEGVSSCRINESRCFFFFLVNDFPQLLLNKEFAGGKKVKMAAVAPGMMNPFAFMMMNPFGEFPSRFDTTIPAILDFFFLRWCFSWEARSVK